MIEQQIRVKARVLGCLCFGSEYRVHDRMNCPVLKAREDERLAYELNANYDQWWQTS